MASVFEYLAYSQPDIILALAQAGLLVIEDCLPAGTSSLMRHETLRRGPRGRMGQRRASSPRGAGQGGIGGQKSRNRGKKPVWQQGFFLYALEAF
ncbi:MAG: hypothetical protein AB1576_12630 [Bacillota bacterium]